MSGGRFNYLQFRVKEISETLKEIIDRQGKPFEDEWEQGEYETFPPDVQQIMLDGIKAIDRAFVYIQRIDWFLCGDDGKDSLIERLKEDLENIDQTKV